MVNPVVKKQELPLAPYQKVYGQPHLGHVLPIELVSYHILIHFIQVGG